MKLGFLAILLGGLAACPAPVGSRAPVDSDSAAQCRQYCVHIGLPLESVVIMASNVGCVCDARPPMAAPAGPPSAPPPPPPTSTTGASSTAGGMAAVMMQEEEENQQQQQHAATQIHH